MIEYYEPFLELELPKPKIDVENLPWLPYNPRKEIKRWGVSLTSLDGGTTGIPDLDSLFEYNRLNQTHYRETDFKTPTPHFAPFQFMTTHFDLGRSHVLRLGSGGFFPYHRDFDPQTFRLIYTLKGCHEQNLVFILDQKVLRLADESWYYINTKMSHSVFSFFGSEFAVFNVVRTPKSTSSLLHNLKIK